MWGLRQVIVKAVQLCFRVLASHVEKPDAGAGGDIGNCAAACDWDQGINVEAQSTLPEIELEIEATSCSVPTD